MNRGLAAALLLCQNKGVAQARSLGSLGAVAGKGWVGTCGCSMVSLGLHCCLFLSDSALSSSPDRQPLIAFLWSRVGAPVSLLCP